MNNELWIKTEWAKAGVLDAAAVLAEANEG
jgi:hypothetical protein